MTRAQIREAVRNNLVDNGITYYKDDNINDVLQDAYNEIAAFSQCIIKHVTLDWQANVNYLDFVGEFAVSDYMGVIAIFNNSTNQWLVDNISIRDLDRIRRDWELWVGAPQFWCPFSQKYTVIAPKYPAVDGQQFTLWYYAVAPELTDDDSTPLVAPDMQDLFEFYATGDLLESAEEVTKAQPWMAKYDSRLLEYKDRCHNLARHDLLLRI